MDQRPKVSTEDSAKPSKLLALIALVIAFALPFVLVKSFPHKQQFNEQTSTELALNEINELEEKAASTRVVQNHPLIELPKPNQASIKTVAEKVAVTAKDPKTLAPAVTKASATTKPIAKPIVKATPVEPSEGLWQIITTRRGDSFATVFNRLGLSAQTLRMIIRDNPHTRALKGLRAEQKLQFLIKNRNLEKMIVPLSSTQYLLISRQGQHYKSQMNTHKMSSYNHYITGTVRGSMYNTAKRLNMPYKLIQQMTEIFTWDINFAKDVRAGDQFTIIYQGLYIEDKLVGTGDIVAVSYKNRGKTFQAIRHTDRAGHSDYYTAQGTSLRKAFNRYPLRFSHISSSFSLGRHHPILRYTRPHKGVDLAAPIGTPILATGDGTIEIIGRHSGYGNMIKINHHKAYHSIYGHMLKFQKGLSKGSFVRRGQVIGYVGQTGLATGPHCHYEFHVNKQAKNPTTVDLPRGFPIGGRELAAFKSKANTFLAQLKLYSEGRFASATSKGPRRV